MLFLLRSAVCIGLVVSALPDRSPAAAAPEAVASGAAALAALCSADAARCRALAGALLPASLGDEPPRKMRDQPAARARLSRPAQVL